jgi:hypothetical protein
MIVFDLKCDVGHVFEAWFGSSESFADQKSRGLLCCGICGSAAVDKAPMAARVPAKGNQRPSGKALTEATSVAANGGADVQEIQKIKTALEFAAKAQAKMLESSQWVGRAFDQKARAMDAREIPHAPIHGEVSPKEAEALKEDGIAISPLPFPVIPPEKRN